MRFRLFFGLLFQCYWVVAQPMEVFKWWNPATSKMHVVTGQAWASEVENTYDRFPARAKQTVNPEVWKLSKQSAGLQIRFKTNAKQITIRYQVTEPLAMPHMPATGVSGVDLYGTDTKGNTLWCAGKYSFKDTIEYKFTDLTPANTDATTGIQYCLYLPLYNAVKWMEIGTPNSSTFIPQAADKTKPIVIYGTSIAQGACASRPGMAWTAILSRKLKQPVINWGFSGAGKLEPEVVKLVNEIDARVFILDCLPNLVGGKADYSASEIYTRITNAVKTIRGAHPKTPIILTDHFGYTDAAINTVKRDKYKMVNRVNHQAFADLKASGIKNLSLLPIEALKQDMDTMVDGIHPTDLGMMRYADAYRFILTKLMAQ
jgi:lysophospholipase L1-like esterase